MRTATPDEKQANQKNRQLTLTNHKKPRTIAPFVNLDRKNVVLWSVVDTLDAATALCVSSERAKCPRICEKGMTVESRRPPINKLTIDELTVENDERAWRWNANICCKVDELRANRVELTSEMNWIDVHALVLIQATKNKVLLWNDRLRSTVPTAADRRTAASHSNSHAVCKQSRRVV